MKYSSIVMPLAIAATFIWVACKKTSAPAPTIHPHPAMVSFPEPYMTEGLDQRLQSVIRSLKSDTRKAATFSEIARKVGKPYWSKALVSNEGNRIICLIPLKKPMDSTFCDFTVIQLDTGLHLSLFRRGSFDRYRHGESGPSALKINHTLNALNNHGFGNRPYNINALTPEEKRIIPNMASRNNRVDQISTDALASFVTCYSWSTCIGDGAGNCEGPTYYFQECTSDFVWFADYPYYMSSGDYGGDGGSGIDDPATGGGASGSDNSNANMPPPRETVPDVTKYLSCFSPAQSGRITFYVDQPTAGTTEPVSILGGIGHTWITLEQQLPGGQLVRRSFGFYPQNKVNPFGNKTSVAAIGNDAGHDFDVSWSSDISAESFNAILQSTQNHAANYHLANYNCVNFVIDVAGAGGIALPRNPTSWIVGSGLNPGSFGEDLRQLPNSNVKKGNTPTNAGNCP